jgi:hypothetical protein
MLIVLTVKSVSVNVPGDTSCMMHLIIFESLIGDQDNVRSDLVPVALCLLVPKFICQCKSSLVL